MDKARISDDFAQYDEVKSPEAELGKTILMEFLEHLTKHPVENYLNFETCSLEELARMRGLVEALPPDFDAAAIKLENASRGDQVAPAVGRVGGGALSEFLRQS